MRVTVCELRTSPGALEQDWDGLVAHVAEQSSDLVVLPEMGFAPWSAAERPGPEDADAAPRQGPQAVDAQRVELCLQRVVDRHGERLDAGQVDPSVRKAIAILQ